MPSMEAWDRILADLHAVGDVDRAVAACYELDRVADESWLPRLHELLAGGRDFFVREAAATPIARMEGLRALPQLLFALQRGKEEGHDNDGLCAVIGDVVDADPERSAAILLPMLHDPDEGVRRDAAWLLGCAAGVITPEPLLAALGDPCREVRAAAIGSLSSFEGRPEVFDGLLRALADDDEVVRAAAGASLGYFGDRRAVLALRNATADPSEQVRSAARYALHQLGEGGWFGRWASKTRPTLPE